MLCVAVRDVVRDAVLARNWLKIDPRASITGVIMDKGWGKRQVRASKPSAGHRLGGSGNLLPFFDLVTKLVTAPVHIILTDGYLVG